MPNKPIILLRPPGPKPEPFAQPIRTRPHQLKSCHDSPAPGVGPELQSPQPIQRDRFDPAPMPFEPLETESAKHYAGFVSYRDLGPDRNLGAAYRVCYSKPDSCAIPGFFRQWCVKFQWVKRALAYDLYLDGEKQKVREIGLIKLTELRLDFELRDQPRRERRVDKIEALLDKADSAPITDVTVRDGKQVTRVKGINMAGYAAVLKQCNASVRLAIDGGRSEPKASANEKPKFTEREIAQLDGLDNAALAEYIRLHDRRTQPPSDSTASDPPRDEQIEAVNPALKQTK